MAYHGGGGMVHHGWRWRLKRSWRTWLGAAMKAAAAAGQLAWRQWQLKIFSVAIMCNQ